MIKLIFTFVLALILCSSFCIQNSYAQWEPDVRLTNAAGNSYTCLNNAWCIAANGNVLHTVWSDNRDGIYQVFYKRSTDNGSTWGADTRLSDTTIEGGNPSVAVSGSLVIVAWSEDTLGSRGIYCKRSADGGTTWGAKLYIVNNAFDQDQSSVAVSGSQVNIVWQDIRDLNYEIYYKRSTDGGITWGADTRLTNNTAASYRPSLAVNGSQINVVWHDDRENQEIYYKRSTDNGITWGIDTRLTNNTAQSNFSSVAVSGSQINVVWQDDRDGNQEIYYKRSTDGGSNWGADIRLTNKTGYSWYPSIAVSGFLVNVVWMDNRDGNNEIYCKRSSDGGTTWEIDTRLTNNTAFSYNPSVAVSGSQVNVVWYDFRDGNNEIYYKRTTPVPAAPSLVSPLNNATNLQPNLLLDWSAVQFASSYSVQIATDSLFTSMVFDTSNVNRDSLRVRPGLLLANIKYFWRVNATNVSGTGQWSIVWNFRINPTGLSISGNEIPSAYSLSQNYPNPFNPTTKIRFDIPKASVGQTFLFVTLSVFDIMGREVVTLVNEQLAPGTYETTFDGSNLSSGTYFYKLTSGDFTQTKRLTLLK